jgi:hypothetical protein
MKADVLSFLPLEICDLLEEEDAVPQLELVR